MNEVPERYTELLDWMLPILRLSLVGLLAKPALSKFLTYRSSVAFFDSFGIPFPEAMVLVAGVVEVGAGLLLLFDVRPRLAAVSLLPVMTVAIAYVGVDWKNSLFMLGSLVVAVSGTSEDEVEEMYGKLFG